VRDYIIETRTGGFQMYNPTFKIMILLTSGEVIEAFTWCRGEKQGIDRALREGAERGYSILECWAEPIVE